MKSKIYTKELVKNSDRKFGSSTEYYPCYIRSNGKDVPALFTQNELNRAMDRARKNAEDIPTSGNWFTDLFGW